MDLLVELLGCAKTAKAADHRGRRALTTAMYLARKAEEADQIATAQIHSELDALGRPAPEKVTPSANFLCSVPPKSD